MVEDYARCSHVRPRTAVMAMTALPLTGVSGKRLAVGRNTPGLRSRPAAIWYGCSGSGSGPGPDSRPVPVPAAETC